MNMQKTKRRRPASAEANTQGLVYALLTAIGKSLLITAIVGIALSLAAAAVAYTAEDPSSLIHPLGLCTLALSAAAMGGCLRRFTKASPLVCTALGGGTLLILTALCRPLLPNITSSPLSPALTWGARGGILLFALLGALLCANAPRRRKKRRKK